MWKNISLPDNNTSNCSKKGPNLCSSGAAFIRLLKKEKERKKSKNP